MDSKTFIDTLAKRLDIPAQEVTTLLSALCESITEASLANDTVAIPGFGSFETRKRCERVTTHPASGERLLVPPRLSLAFRPSATLRQKVRNYTPNPADGSTPAESSDIIDITENIGNEQ